MNLFVEKLCEMRCNAKKLLIGDDTVPDGANGLAGTSSSWGLDCDCKTHACHGMLMCRPDENDDSSSKAAPSRIRGMPGALLSNIRC